MRITHYEVRFHLLNGKHHRHWQIKACCGSKKVKVEYLDPAQGQLEMEDCLLFNNLKKAKKVFAAQRKDVSGWVKCKKVRVVKKQPTDYLERLHYNPKVDVHWRRESDCGEFVWDDSKYSTLLTEGRTVYVLEERG